MNSCLFLPLWTGGVQAARRGGKEERGPVQAVHVQGGPFVCFVAVGLYMFM